MPSPSAWTDWVEQTTWQLVEAQPGTSEWTDWAEATTFGSSTSEGQARLLTEGGWVELGNPALRLDTGWLNLTEPAFPPPVEMEPTLLNSFGTSTGNASSTGPMPVGQALPTGTLLVVFAASAGGLNREFTITDSAGLEWNRALDVWPSAPAGSAHTVAAWTALLPSSIPASAEITVNLNVSTVLGASVYAIRGAHPENPISDAVPAESDTSIAVLTLPAMSAAPGGYYLIGGISGAEPHQQLETYPETLFENRVLANGFSTRRFIVYGGKSTSHSPIEAQQMNTQSQQSAIGLAITPKVQEVPAAGTVVHMWTGAPTHDSAVVYTRSQNTTASRLAYSTSPSMTNASYADAEVPDIYGITRHYPSGLQPNTRYYFQLTDVPPGGSEVRIGPVGTIKTLATPGTPVPTRKVIIGGCLNTNAAVTVGLQRALEWNPDWGHFNGDFFYNGHSSLLTEAQWVERYNNQISNTGQHLKDFLAAGVAAYELVSDHDSTEIDNGDSNIPSAPFELAGWRRSVPHLPDSGDETTRDQQWDDGRVSYFMIDCRSVNRSPGSDPDVPGKTMLGAAQLSRLLDWLDTNPAPFKVIISDAPWMGQADIVAKPDAWWSYATERQQIIDAIHAGGDHVEVWHGDSHLVGYATAAKNTWGNFPVLCAAPYYQSGGGRNQSTFNQVFNNGGQWAAVFGRVTFTDDGNEIVRTFEGYDAMTSTVQFTDTVTVQTP